MIKGKRSQHEITEPEKNLIVASILTSPKRDYPQARASRPAVAAMFEVSWLLGLRFSEARWLLKKDLNVKARTLRVIRGKTTTVSVLKYIPDIVINLLTGCQSDTECFFDIKCSAHTVARMIRVACEANGVIYGRDEPDGITFHSPGTPSRAECRGSLTRRRRPNIQAIPV
jgi:integrase